MDIELRTADYNMKLVSGVPEINRNLVFADGSTISFTVTLEKDSSASITQMHRRSAAKVIGLLQAWLGPEPVPPTKE